MLNGCRAFPAVGAHSHSRNATILAASFAALTIIDWRGPAAIIVLDWGRAFELSRRRRKCDILHSHTSRGDFDVEFFIFRRCRQRNGKLETWQDEQNLHDDCHHLLDLSLEYCVVLTEILRAEKKTGFFSFENSDALRSSKVSRVILTRKKSQAQTKSRQVRLSMLILCQVLAE